MAKGFFNLRAAGILAALLTALLLAVAAQGLSAPGGGVIKAPDVLHINGLNTFGSLERLPVPFKHDKHTAALAKQGKDCFACHLKDQDGTRSLKFNRLSNQSKDQAMDAYHAGCISCHEEALSAGRDSGPITCGECHTGSARMVSTRVKPDFDKSLHYRHVKAANNQCDSCHHEYDEKASKTVYVKGKESSCTYCHGPKTLDRVESYRGAAHEQCISCHEEKLAKKLESGPVDCGGCHGAAELAKLEKLTEIPRLERGQPEAVLVSGREPDPAGEPVQRMKLVPFDHKAHETYNDSCIACHHASLQSCAQCHTQKGKKEGGGVSLERAMHSTADKQSCLGCHGERQKQPDCAGCHQRRADAFENKESCESCHQGDPLPQGADKEAASQAALQALAANKRVTPVVADEDIPEVVKIGAISKEFDPAELPHRKIVKAIQANLTQSPLARTFHKEGLTICGGCHHNSPPSLKPPQCGSCHAKPFNPQKMSMPGLKAAYHQQCMNCHAAMKLEKPQATACTECHKQKD